MCLDSLALFARTLGQISHFTFSFLHILPFPLLTFCRVSHDLPFSVLSRLFRKLCRLQVFFHCVYTSCASSCWSQKQDILHIGPSLVNATKYGSSEYVGRNKISCKRCKCEFSPYEFSCELLKCTCLQRF